MSKKMLAISGSPHKNGITSTMLASAINAAERAGYEVATINLYDEDIAFCKGCRSCSKTKDCFQKDSMVKITSLLKACDIVVLAAPVYWANVPAVVKNLFDRLFGVAMEETTTFPKPLLTNKKYIILTACNTPSPFAWLFGQSRWAIRSIDEFFKTAGLKPLGKFVHTNAKDKKTVSEKMIKRISKCIR